MTITSTSFINNAADGDGGAIGNFKGLAVKDSYFEDNKAQQSGTHEGTLIGGGAIALGAESTTTIANTTFKNNTSGTNGGAIATRQAKDANNSAAKLDIAATFIGNKAQQGGAIYNSFYTDNGLGKGAGVTVTGTFSVNEATGKGGAIYNDGTLDQNSTKPSGGIMTITDATFDGNKADFGGAIFNTGTLTINRGSFEGNTAKSAAGAIYNNAGATLMVDGVTFASNSSAIAGAINNNDGTVTIKKSTFKGNDAGKSMGGAVRNNSGSAPKKSITIKGSTFEGNKAGNGGAVWNGSDGKVEIADSTFKGNTALVGDAQQGGAITNADQMTITGSTFEGNKAGKLGGAIYNAGNLTLNNSTFTGNSATGEHAHGGAIFNAGTITFTGSNTFAGGGANDIFNARIITVTDGTTTLDSGLSLAAGSTTTVEEGGALVVNGITEWKTQGTGLGSLTVNGGALTLQKDDVLEGYNTPKKDTSLSVTSGSLYLINNSNYTATDFTAAKGALVQKNVLQTGSSFGFVGGTLVGADNKATDLVVSSNTIGSTTEFTEGLPGTTVHNNSFLENDLKVDAGTNDEVSINGADVAVNKVNITGSATSLTIDNGSLTVVGGNAKDKLIATNGNALTTIKVKSNSKLNLGSAAIPERGAGTLGSAEIALDSNGSLNASNGDYTVGAVTGTGAVTADAANIKATDGDITANTVTLKNNGLLAASKKDDTIGGNITINNALSGQGSVVADKTLTLGANYTGAADDVLTLQAGENITATGKDLTQAAGGKLTVVAGGTIKAANISATNVAAKTLTASGDVAVDGGTLDLTGTGAADASTVASLKLTNGTQATVADLKLDGGIKTLTVGTGDDTVGGTTLSAKHINLNEGMLLVDPAWDQASSNVAVASLSGTASEDDVTVNGSVGVGQNSYLALGTDNTGWLRGVVGNYTKGVGLSQTGITAAMGLYKGITIGTDKALLVDGSKVGDSDGALPYDVGSLEEYLTASANANSATFADNSLLVVNGADEAIAAGGAAITFAHTTGGTLTVAEGAKLLVTDAVAGQDYTIVGNVNNPGTDLAGWKNNGVTSTTDMISLGDAKFDSTGTTTPGKVTTKASRNDAHTVFPNLSDGMANAVNDLYTGHDGAAGKPRWDYADVNSADMGVRFLSRATDNRFLGADKNAAAESIESAARIAFAGAVPQMTKMASDAGTNAVVNRLGFADPA
ncbi:beta strand repeat-containing protein, partial [Desulfovibrio piger]